MHGDKGDNAYLLALTTTHEGRLSALDVHISPHLVVLGEGRCLSLLNGSVDVGLGLLVEFLRYSQTYVTVETRVSSTDLDVLLGGETPLLDVAREATDGVVGLTHPLNLITGTVGRAGVGHTAHCQHWVRAASQKAKGTHE